MRLSRNDALAAAIVIPAVLLAMTPFVVAIALLRAFVLRKLWLWFVVPQFGLDALSYPAAIGVALVWSFLCPYPIDYAKEPESTAAKRAVQTFAGPPLALFVGWVVQHWMR
jgi:hypothetical protein